jgi:hypothetical protein
MSPDWVPAAFRAAYNRLVQRRCLLAVVVSILVGVVAASVYASGETRLLSAHGIGNVRFGVAKERAVRELSSVLGQPSRRFVSDGCGANLTEVEWGHLYAEFRQGRFSGFRYMKGVWLKRGVLPGYGYARLQPRLATTRGITLGSKLNELRRAYGRLDLVGTDRWMVGNGLIFYDDSKTEPPAGSSRIDEIKVGTCGDF